MGGAATASSLASCAGPIRYPGPFNVEPKADTDIVVDAHCHIFNGRDIDISAYALALTREKLTLAGYAVVREVVASILESVSDVAPCITKETDRLDEVLKSVKGMDPNSPARRRKLHEQLLRRFDCECAGTDADTKNCIDNINKSHTHWPWKWVKSAFSGYADRKAGRLSKDFHEALAASIERRRHESQAGHDLYHGNFAEKDKAMLHALQKQAAYLVVHFANYRTINAYELWQQFNPDGGPRNVDLFVAASLDMNAWLNANLPSKKPTDSGFKGDITYMKRQVDFMEKIAVLFNGDMMPMAGWCPRFAAEVSTKIYHELHKHHFEHPLKTLIRAVDSQGHLGAKLYPPMGFQAYNNKEIDESNFPWFHGFNGLNKEQELRAYGTPAKLGEKLDVELRKLYEHCAAHDVPIMAHTGPSHGAQIGYALRANPRYWDAVLNPSPPEQPGNLGLSKLRVNLAHLGCWHADGPFSLARLVGGSDNANWGRKIAEMVATHPNVYSDLADMADIGESEKWRDQFDSAFSEWSKFPKTSPKNQLGRKLMYGTDWFVMAQGDVLRDDDKKFDQPTPDLSGMVGRTYLSRWADYLHTRHKPDASAMLGHNAMRFLGMDLSKTRHRVDTFFDKHDMQPPAWRKKLDVCLKKGLV